MTEINWKIVFRGAVVIALIAFSFWYFLKQLDREYARQDLINQEIIK